MPRNHSKSSARPAARPVNTAPPRREAHTATAAAPTPMAAAQAPAPTYMPQQQGIMSQIATTAAGVAAGHVAGRMLTGLFTGSGSSDTAAAMPVEQGVSAPTNFGAQKSMAPQCQEYSKLFLQCMEQNGNQVATCQDYMEMMKSCQQQYA